MMSRLNRMSTLQWIGKTAVIVLLSTITPCIAQLKAPPELNAAQPPATPDWQLITRDAGWQARDSQGELVHDGRLWVFGGWFNSFEAPPRDVWSTMDGEAWSLVE